MRFNEKYTISLDYGSGYEEILAAKVNPFNYEREKDQYFWRYKWGEVVFSNNPKSDSELTNNKYLGYDKIADAGYFQEIKIKYEDSARTIEGYFSHKDCNFQSGKHFKIIRVTPTILDQYTPLLENWEEKIGIIGGEIEAVGFWRLRPINYNQFSNHILPLALKSSNIPKAKDAAGDNPVTNKFIYKATKGYILNVSVSAKAKNISGSGSYIIYLKKYDKDLVEIDSSVITSRSIEVEIDETEFSGNGSVNIAAGQSIALTVEMGIGSLDYTTINVSVSGNPINVTTKEITIQFNENNLKEYRRWSINNHGVKLIKLSKRPLLTDYFEDAASDIPYAPKASKFGSVEFGMQDKDDLYLYESKDLSNGLVDILGNQDYELSEVTVWRGRTIRKWFRKEVYYYCTCIFSREEIITKDENGVPQEPEGFGEGWEPRETAPDGQAGYTLYTRLPYNGAYTEWTLGDEIIADGDPYEDNGYFRWSNKLTSKRNYPREDITENFSNAIDLYTLIKYIYNNTAYPSGDVKSTFLWNDYESDIPTLSAGQNYATSSHNWFNNTVCLPTINLKQNIDTSNDDSKLELSFKDFMEDFRQFFALVGQGNLYWFIQLNSTTGEYDLRIEHIEFLDIASGVYTFKNLQSNETYRKYLEETYNYSYDDSDMFRQITMENVNSGYQGFKENEVIFEKIVSNTRDKDLLLETQTKIFSTDIQFAKENPNDLENGLIWLDIDENDEVVRSDVYGLEVPNGRLALSNLLNSGIFRYEGVWENGTINGTIGKSFENTLRNLMCENFSIPDIHIAEFITTGIGKGMTESIEFDPEKLTTNLKLAFRKMNAPSDISLKSGETTNLDGFYLMVQKESDFTGAENIYFDFGNYEN
ncbi:MAG: hypothetical protein ACOCUV_00900 [bacterium]